MCSFYQLQDSSELYSIHFSRHVSVELLNPILTSDTCQIKEDRISLLGSGTFRQFTITLGDNTADKKADAEQQLLFAALKESFITDIPQHIVIDFYPRYIDTYNPRMNNIRWNASQKNEALHKGLLLESISYRVN